MKIHLVLLGALCSSVLAAPPVFAGADSKVEASMTYRGVTMKLDHVLIVRHGNEENAPQQPELRIYLSDQDIPLTIAESANTLAAKAYARRGNFNGVVIVAFPTSETSGAVTYVLHAPGIPAGTSVSTINGDALSHFLVAGGRASGTVAIDSDDLKIDATFDAPVALNPITEDLKGASALGSAPAKAMLVCTHAVHMADMDALARLNSASRMQGLSEFRAEAGDKAFREELMGEPDADAVAKTVTRVIVRGENASVIMGESAVAELVLEGGVWKCD